MDHLDWETLGFGVLERGASAEKGGSPIRSALRKQNTRGNPRPTLSKAERIPWMGKVRRFCLNRRLWDREGRRSAWTSSFVNKSLLFEMGSSWPNSCQLFDCIRFTKQDEHTWNIFFCYTIKNKLATEERVKTTFKKCADLVFYICKCSYPE